MAIIRFIVGKILLFINWLTFPAKGQRAESLQRQVEKELKDMSLYQFEACPFCVKVRRALQRLNLPVELRDAKTEPFRQQLLEGGGKVKVPCLKILENGTERWMYESNDIISFLEKRFPLASNP